LSHQKLHQFTKKNGIVARIPQKEFVNFPEVLCLTIRTSEMATMRLLAKNAIEDPRDQGRTCRGHPTKKTFAIMELKSPDQTFHHIPIDASGPPSAELPKE
jgi:hypothetical protein